MCVSVLSDAVHVGEEGSTLPKDESHSKSQTFNLSSRPLGYSQRVLPRYKPVRESEGKGGWGIMGYDGRGYGGLFPCQMDYVMLLLYNTVTLCCYCIDQQV